MLLLSHTHHCYLKSRCAHCIILCTNMARAHVELLQRTHDLKTEQLAAHVSLVLARVHPEGSLYYITDCNQEDIHTTPLRQCSADACKSD